MYEPLRIVLIWNLVMVPAPDLPDGTTPTEQAWQQEAEGLLKSIVLDERGGEVEVHRHALTGRRAYTAASGEPDTPSHTD